MNRLQEYNISTQARSRYSSLAAVLGSKTPRRVPAVLKYLLMISVISLQPIFTLLYFVLFVSKSTTLCLSPHPKPSCRWCRWSTVMTTMKKTRHLKINTFMQHKPIPSLLHIKNRMRIRNIHTNYRCILFYHIRFLVLLLDGMYIPFYCIGRI